MPSRAKSPLIAAGTDRGQDVSETEQRTQRSRRGSNAAGPRAGIRDVARLAGVSTATVSRAYNAPDTVSEKVRAQVEQAARSLSYIPHNAARALSSQRSRTLGIVIPTMQNSIFAAQVESLQRRALVRNGIDGIMLVGADHLPETYRLLKARGIAYVNTSVCDLDSPHPNVGFDNRAAMAHTANYLISLGHRNIAVICGDARSSDRARLRLEGARQAMQQAGLALPDTRIAHSDYTMDASRAACRELVRRAPETTAIMCHNDVQAFAALLELQTLGLAVPRDISVTGFDDLEWARHLRPGLTTVRVPWARMAEIAADMLVAQLDGEEFRHATLLDFDLVVRDSTAPPRPLLIKG